MFFVIYFFRTNQTGKDAAALWQEYILITIEFSRSGAGKLFCNNQLYFPTREFLTLKGIL